MRISKRLTGVLFALCALVAGVSTASAQLISTGTTNTFFSMSDDWFGYVPYQPFANVRVDSATNVNIGGFGVYGRAEASGKVAWVVFDNTDNYNLLTPQPVTRSVSTGDSGWFDLSMSMTLQAGHTYTMGLAATDLFAWGRTTPSAISQNGLTILGNEPIVGVYTSNYPDSGGNFTQGGFERLVFEEGDVDYFRGTLRVLSPGGSVPPIPEPAEWTMLLAGLMVVAFVANRQRRRIN